MKRTQIAMLKICLHVVFVFAFFNSFSQMGDAVFKSSIKSVRLNVANKQLSLPIYRLNSSDQLSLSFDDMDADVKNYYYTYQLCDYDWQPVDLNTSQYVKGFSQVQLTSYQYSSLSYVHYTHYNITLPDPTCIPILSGNYIVKIFLDGDTSQTVITRRMLVVESKATVFVQIMQPFVFERAKVDQRVKFSVSIDGLDMFDAGQQVKVKVLQNNRWDNSMGNIPPAFIRGNVLDYDAEDNFVFPGGMEWRWLDMRTLKLQSAGMKSFNNQKTPMEAYLRTDIDRSSQPYTYYSDINGRFIIQNSDNLDPNYEADYANIHFSFSPPNQTPYDGKDLYLIGQLTDYVLSDSNKLQFNTDKGIYEITKLLKQGYYNYGYLLVDKNDPSQRSELDGNFFETENNYTILVYYRSFSDRNDRLIGISRLDTRSDKPATNY